MLLNTLQISSERTYVEKFTLGRSKEIFSFQTLGTGEKKTLEKVGKGGIGGRWSEDTNF